MKSSCFTAHEMFLLMNFIHVLVRYAAGGMWGRDSYFCDDVRMANYFAYNVPDSNLKQILMLRLLAGRTIELGADPALLLPHSVPQKNNNFVSKLLIQLLAIILLVIKFSQYTPMRDLIRSI